jgi:hypothetical protein
MANSASEVAVFNLERTVVDVVFGNALADIEAANLACDLEPENGSSSISQDRERFLGWLAGKTELEIDPLLELTAEQAAERLLPWACLVMNEEVQMDRLICLYSVTVPQDILEAYAEGIEDAITGADVKFVFGKPTEKIDGRYTGKLGGVNKARTVEQLIAQGLGIHFIADSFVSGFPAFKYARHAYAINPNAEVTRHKGEISWHYENPDLVSVRLPSAPTWDRFDLSVPSEQEDFVGWLQLDN